MYACVAYLCVCASVIREAERERESENPSEHAQESLSTVTMSNREEGTGKHRQILPHHLLSLQVGSMITPTFLPTLYHVNIANKNLMGNNFVRD